MLHDSFDPVTVLRFSGTSGGVAAPTINHVPVTMVELNLEEGASYTQALPGDYNGFFYILEGEGAFGSGDDLGSQGQTLLLGSSDGAIDSTVTVRATQPLKALLYAGRPLGEPVVSYGPFVMNTRQEIIQAVEDYRSGRFAK